MISVVDTANQDFNPILMRFTREFSQEAAKIYNE